MDLMLQQHLHATCISKNLLLVIATLHTSRARLVCLNRCALLSKLENYLFGSVDHDASPDHSLMPDLLWMCAHCYWSSDTSIYSISSSSEAKRPLAFKSNEITCGAK